MYAYLCTVAVSCKEYEIVSWLSGNGGASCVWVGRPTRFSPPNSSLSASNACCWYIVLARSSKLECSVKRRWSGTFLHLKIAFSTFLQRSGGGSIIFGMQAKKGRRKRGEQFQYIRIKAFNSGRNLFFFLCAPLFRNSRNISTLFQWMAQ